MTSTTPAAPARGPRWAFAPAGVLAAAAGMAVGHVVATIQDPAYSPVLAVGSQVVDLTPTPVKEWAVATFGTADKPILLGSVGVGTLLLAALAGLLARHRTALGAGLLCALVALAGAAALARPTAGPASVVPALATAAVGIGVLALLTHMADGLPTGGGGGTGGSRRRFLVGAAGVALGTAAAVTVGQRLAARPSDAHAVTLPPPADAPRPLPAGLERTYGEISPFRTPARDFYRVDTNLSVPRVRTATWSLTVDGSVLLILLTLSYDDLLALPMVERDITLTCVSNEVGGSYVGAARWLGVPLVDLLERVGVTGDPDQILSTAVDGFTISTPLSVALDGRDTLVAVGMNGAPLPEVHGFPARLVTPGLYGFVGATKWLTRLTLTTYAAEQAYWTERDWATDAPIKTSARVDTPRPLSTISAGRTVIGGVAWAQHRGVGRVEVRIDGGDWQRAVLGPDGGIDYWRQWYLPWDAKAGSHRIAVRAVDLSGDVQTAKRATPFPAGSSGIQEILVTVS